MVRDGSGSVFDLCGSQFKEEMMKLSKQSKLFILMGLLFTAPGFLALWAFYHPQWLIAHTINKGQLFKEPVQLDLQSEDKKWNLVYWAQSPCEADCAQQLDKLFKVRLALGRRYYEVNEVLLTHNSPAQLQAQLKQQAIQVHELTSQEDKLLQSLSEKYHQPEFFILSPDNHFVLAYEKNAGQKDIYKDIKHLLSVTNN